MSRRRSFAAFIDLSGVDAAGAARAVEALARPDRLGGLVTRAVVHAPGSTLPCPEGWAHAGSVSAGQACAWAFDGAAAADLPLVIVAGGAQPSSEALATLAEALELDPLFGVAVPRFAEATSGRVTLHDPWSPGTETAPRRILASLTDYRIVSERVAPCLLIRRELIGNLAFTQGPALWPSVADFVLRARHAGFRPVVCNRAVVALEASGSPANWGCTPEEIAQLRHLRGEAGQPVPPGDAATRGERLLARAVDAPRSLLLDARNLTPVQNGTSIAILGACDALHRVRPDRAVSIWMHPDAADFYASARRFGNWTVLTETPADRYAASLRLSQPWHASELDLLRDVAAVNVFWMLDTIAWDIGYAAPPGLDDTWQRLGADADGILFISQFSRERFAHRFAVSPGLLMDTCPLSLDPGDYAIPAAPGPEPPYWLVVGNRYDHKHVGPTVDLLARAFPLRHLVAFGDRQQPRGTGVTRFASGSVDSALMRGCYARADAVIFPSFYEGFGLPMVEGLAYGRTVVVRDSTLVRELAARYRGPGQLFVFSTERELVDVLGRLDRGDVSGALSLGAGAGHEIWNWDAVAACMLRTVDRLVAVAPSPQMLRRTTLSRGLGHPDRQRD
jgi:glycosyltransferase involved in cell wall biosynthesis